MVLGKGLLNTNTDAVDSLKFVSYIENIITVSHHMSLFLSIDVVDRYSDLWFLFKQSISSFSSHTHLTIAFEIV